MDIVISLLMLLIAVVILAAWLMSISLIINAIKAKGYDQITTGTLWFIGIFASPMILGLYAIVLPEKREAMDRARPQSDDLPSI